MNIKVSSKNSAIKLIACIIVLLPLLNYYDLPFTTVSMVTISLFVEFLLLVYVADVSTIKVEKKDIRIWIPYLILTIYILIISCTFNIINSNIQKIYILIALIINTANIILIHITIKKEKKLSEYIINTYLVICFLLCIITIVEELVFLLKGILVPVKIDFLPLISEMEKLGYRFGYNWRGNYVGFSPFFSEPSHMAQFMLPAIAFLMLLFEKHPIRAGIFLILILIAIVLSTSTYGIVSSIAMIVFFILFNKKYANKMRKIFFLFSPVFASVFFIFIRKRLLYDGSVMSNLSFSSEKSTYRLYRGIAYFLQFPLINKLFGVGFNNMSSFIQEHNLTYEYEIISDDVVSEYINGASQALIYGGLIGLFLLIMFIAMLYKYSTNECNALIFALCLLFITSATFLRGNSVFYIIMIMSLRESFMNDDGGRK